MNTNNDVCTLKLLTWCWRTPDRAQQLTRMPVCVNMRAEVILNSVISKLEQARGLCSLSQRLFRVYGVSNVLGSNPNLTTTFYQLILTRTLTVASFILSTSSPRSMENDRVRLERLSTFHEKIKQNFLWKSELFKRIIKTVWL